MTESQKLLAEYAKTGSETAFRGLLTRYADLVYSAALRLVNGNNQLAEDVTQTVFVDLAKMARKLPTQVMLGGWLHRHTCFAASNLMRSERRRLARERRATEMNALQSEPDDNFTKAAPFLDEAINQLSSKDRTAILLRFFEQHDFRAVGEALGSTEEAAKKRVSRALDKLYRLLRARGLNLSVAALAAFLSTEVIKAAPPALVSGIAATVGSAAIVQAATFNLFKIMTASKLSWGLAGAVVIAGIAYSAKQRQIQAQLREEGGFFHRQVEQSIKEALGLSNQLALLKSDHAHRDQELRELLRLRAEVASLRNQLIEAQKLIANRAAQRQEAPQDGPTSYAKSPGRDAKILGYALRVYAMGNGMQPPTDLSQLVPCIGEALRNDLNPGEALRDESQFVSAITNQFEVVYRGSLSNQFSGEVILLREKYPSQTPRGTWIKAYGFADGSGGIHEEPDGNFEQWEKNHSGL